MLENPLVNVNARVENTSCENFIFSCAIIILFVTKYRCSDSALWETKDVRNLRDSLWAPIIEHACNNFEMNLHYSNFIIQCQLLQLYRRSRNFVRILLLDYSKAFDLINHQIVLQKLTDMGTPALLLRWIAAFLTARQQQVRIGGSQSSWLQLCGGAPQCTLLGVILFVVHINDLEFECQYSKYVDDTNIMHISSDPASATLQNDADTAHTWSSQNDMIINATKTKELRIDFSKSRGPFTQLYIGNSPIEVVSDSKILGVIISDDLKWNQHVEYIHYDDVIMTMLASQITSLTVVYSIVYSGVNQRKHQSSASLAFVREIHRGPVNFPHKWPVTRKMFPFDDVIMHWQSLTATTFIGAMPSSWYPLK